MVSGQTAFDSARRDKKSTNFRRDEEVGGIFIAAVAKGRKAGDAGLPGDAEHWIALP
jgi:hypothetical protein